MKETFYDNIGEKTICKTAKCGLRVYVIPKKGYSKTYAIIATDFGSVDREFIVEGKKITVPDGIAHFLEHKMFEQPDGSNAFDEFAKYGANANAFTSFEMTGYLFSTSQNYEECLRHLLNYVSTPYFTDENVAKEQGIIGQEIKMYDDSPTWTSFFNMLRCMYKNHPINIDIAGDCEEIAKITKETLYTCYNSYYHPKNMMLCVVGDADADKVLEIVDSVIKETPFKKAETQLPFEGEDVACEFAEKKMSVANPLYAIGFKEKFPGDVIESQAIYNVLLECILGKGSELYNEMYEKGDIFSLSVSYNISRGCAFVDIEGEAENPDKVYEKILGEIEKARKDGIGAESIEIAKKSLYGKYVRRLNDVEEIATSFVSNSFMSGDYFKYGDALLNVDTEKMQELLQTGFKKSVLSKIMPCD